MFGRRGGVPVLRVLFLTIALVAGQVFAGTPNAASAQEYQPGWYDAYGDGCRYWYNGVAYSGEVDCDGDGYADQTSGDSQSDCAQNPIAVSCDELPGQGSQESDCAQNPMAIPCGEPVQEPSEGQDAGYWAEDYCYYQGGVQLGCLLSDETGLYYYENASGLWYLVEEYEAGASGGSSGGASGGTADCSQNPTAVSCEELERQASTQEGFWGTDDCYYDASGAQLGCLLTDGVSLYYLENATGAWYLVEAHSDGSWTYTLLESTTDEQRAETEAQTSEEFVYAQIDALNDYWDRAFDGAGREFRETGVVLAEEPVASQCKEDPVDDTADWVFYCFSDQAIFFAPGVLRMVASYGVDVLLFYVGHEMGHHVAYWSDPAGSGAGYAADPVPYELQANCLSGVWFAFLANQGTIEAESVENVRAFLRNAKDDGIHGTPEQQESYFLSGYKTGAC